MEFISEKFKLRRWKKTHVLSIVKHANNRKIADNLRDGFPYPYTENDARNWIEMAMNENKCLFLAIHHRS